MRSAVLVAAATVALTCLGVPAATAAGTERAYNGVCDVDEFCLYYNSSAWGFGSLADFPASSDYLGDDRFRSAGAGRGQVVEDNAAAYWNRTRQSVYVYTQGQAGGIQGTIPAGLGRRDFSRGYKNQVASFRCFGCVRR